MKRLKWSFRRGRGTIDAIYILNHIINRKVTKRRGKVFMLFADLKAAFEVD